MNFDGKTVLVTGASRGLGREIARAFAFKDAVVHGIARTHDNHPEEFNLWRGDISMPNKAKSILGFIDKIDILVNNAAITADALVHKMTDEQWREVLDVNLTGAFNCTRAVLPGMRERGWGRIINIVSVVAQAGCIGAANYAASKAGLIGLTKSIALENAHKGVTCNAVALGFMGVGMCERLPDAVKKYVLERTPMGRFGTPEEAVAAVLFLASEEAGFITGEVLNVNGGYRI